MPWCKPSGTHCTSSGQCCSGRCGFSVFFWEMLVVVEKFYFRLRKSKTMSMRFTTEWSKWSWGTDLILECVLMSDVVSYENIPTSYSGTVHGYVGAGHNKRQKWLDSRSASASAYTAPKHTKRHLWSGLCSYNTGNFSDLYFFLAQISMQVQYDIQGDLSVSSCMTWNVICWLSSPKILPYPGRSWIALIRQVYEPVR